MNQQTITGPWDEWHAGWRIGCSGAEGKGAEADAQLFVSGFSSLAQGDPPVEHENILTFSQKKKKVHLVLFLIFYYLPRSVWHDQKWWYCNLEMRWQEKVLEPRTWGDMISGLDDWDRRERKRLGECSQEKRFYREEHGLREEFYQVILNDVQCNLTFLSPYPQWNSQLKIKNLIRMEFIWGWDRVKKGANSCLGGADTRVEARMRKEMAPIDLITSR